MPAAHPCGIVLRLAQLSQALQRAMEYKTYMCVICGFIYDEEKGWPDDGIAPGTRWEDVPLTWTCPECGASKDDFEMVEV